MAATTENMTVVYFVAKEISGLNSAFTCTYKSLAHSPMANKFQNPPSLNNLR